MIINSLALDQNFQTSLEDVKNILLGFTIQFITLYEQQSEKPFHQLVFPFLSDNSKDKSIPAERQYYTVSLLNIPSQNIQNRLYVKIITQQYIKQNKDDPSFKKIFDQYEQLQLHQVTFITFPQESDGISKFTVQQEKEIDKK